HPCADDAPLVAEERIEMRDRRCRAAAQPEIDHDAARPQAFEAVTHGGAADRIDDDVDAVATAPAAYRRADLGLAIAHHLVGAHAARERRLLGGAHGGDDLSAERLGNLDRHAAAA